MRAGGHEDLVQGEASEQRDLPGTSGRWQSGDYARREPGAFADFQKMLLVGGRYVLSVVVAEVVFKKSWNLAEAEFSLFQ